MATIQIEDSHDSMFVEDYVGEIVNLLLARSLGEYNMGLRDVNMSRIRGAIGVLQTAVDDIMIDAKADYEEMLADREAFERDPYAYNGVSRSDFF